MAKQGRRIGSKVKLTPAARKLYPQFSDKTGRITGREVLTQGHGLARGSYHSYKISYNVRWDGDKRDYFLGSEHLTKA